MKIDKKYLIILVIIIVAIIGIIIYYLNINKDEENLILEDEIVETVNKVENEQVKTEENFIVIHIIGQINKPGVVKLKEGSRIVDAIELAGGITNKANLNKINLAYVLNDGEQIYIPSIDEKEESEVTYQNKEKKININSANIQELTKIPGIGETIAEKIVKYRKEKGKFKSIEEIKNVSGIGDSKYKNIKDFICVK